MIVNQLIPPMTESTFSQRKSKQLRERSSSTKNLPAKREIKPAEYLGHTAKYNDCQAYMAKANKEYNQNEYDLSSHKKGENNDYIKSLYKKYLGKENQNQSDRKGKNQNKAQKVLFKNGESKELMRTQTKADASCTPLVIRHSATLQSCGREVANKLFKDVSERGSTQIPSKYISALSISTPREIKLPKQRQNQAPTFYKQWMNESTLQLMGNPRSSLVRCMKNICRAKRIIALRTN